MYASGLQELMGFVYGSDTVEHILSGKAVSRSLWAHLLIQSALVTLLLQRIIPRATQESAEITDDNDSALIADDVRHLVNLCAFVSQSSQDYNQTDILQCASLQKVDQQFQSVKQQVSASSRTAKLWIKYTGSHTLYQMCVFTCKRCVVCLLIIHGCMMFLSRTVLTLCIDLTGTGLVYRQILSLSRHW